ncbi:MAG: cell division FtsA domain-containing protein [Spirochaetales bacterium]
MAKTEVAILDFGSSKITVLIAERGINNTFNIKGRGESEYYGFAEGEFFDTKELELAMGLAINNAISNSGTKIKKIYVGVPAEFCYLETKEVSQAYGNKKRINDDDIYNLFDMADNYYENKTHTVINRSPIYFILDDNRKIIDPNGIVTTKLSAKVSFILAENKFIDLIDDIMEKLSIPKAEYISSPLAESLYLLEPETRDKLAILVDCGHITTSVALSSGDGLLSLSAFSIGGGHITGDLNQCLNLSFADAEGLKRKVVLSLDASDDDFYETNVKGIITPIPAKMVNEIVESRLDMIASTINKILNATGYTYPDYLPVYLTGGGLSYLKGGKDYLSKVMGRNIEIIVPPIPQLNRPHYSSALGLLDLALKEEESMKKNIFQLILEKIRNR